MYTPIRKYVTTSARMKVFLFKCLFYSINNYLERFQGIAYAFLIIP